MPWTEYPGDGIREYLGYRDWWWGALRVFNAGRHLWNILIALARRRETTTRRPREPRLDLVAPKKQREVDEPKRSGGCAPRSPVAAGSANHNPIG